MLRGLSNVISFVVIWKPFVKFFKKLHRFVGAKQSDKLVVLDSSLQDEVEADFDNI